MEHFNRRAAHLRLFELIFSAILGALAFALKVAMAALPNIHPVALLFILAATVIGWRAMVACTVYVVMEGIFFGFSTWWIPYLYAWPILVAAAVLLRSHKNPFFWATLAGLHGLVFGLFFLPVNYFVYDMANTPGAVWLYLVNDLPFSAIHAISNFVLVLILLPPLQKGMHAILRRLYHT